MLEGRLDDFSLPDVFQLLALTGKTGTLRLHYADTAGVVIFRDGRVVGAFDDVRRTAPGTRMFAAGLIDEPQLEAAIEASEHGADGGVIGALVAAGAVDEETVADFRRQQAEDAVFALMRLSEVTFSIEAGQVPALPGEVELNTEQLIVEGGRRLGEWTEIRRRVPGRQSVPALVADPPGEGPVTVGRDQWRLMALIDGRRTVADLVALLGSGEYTTAAELAGLVDAGLIMVGDRATHAVGARTRGERLRELETRELGLMRDDAEATPEVAIAGTGAAAGDHAASAEMTAGAAEAPGEEHTPSPPAEPPRRSTLQATLISGIELYDDAEEIDPAPKAAVSGEHGESDAPDAGPGSADDEVSQAPPPSHGPLPAPGGRTSPGQQPPGPGDDEPPQDAAHAEAGAPDDSEPSEPSERRLTRDEDINKALLLRLIDGVKGV